MLELVSFLTYIACFSGLFIGVGIFADRYVMRQRNNQGMKEETIELEGKRGVQGEAE